MSSMSDSSPEPQIYPWEGDALVRRVGSTSPIWP